MKYISIKNIAILIFIISISANLFYFGKEAINKERQKYFEAGNLATRNAIYEGVVKNGEVVITNGEGKEIILIIKK